jgi:transcriptional regulator with XRE-family HTH domain
MKAAERARLEKAGWAVGSAYDFLELSHEERALVDLKLSLSAELRARRRRRRITQADLAERLGSSQSRVAKMEAGDPGVSIDLLVRGLLSMGVTKQELGRAVQGSVNATAKGRLASSSSKAGWSGTRYLSSSRARRKRAGRRATGVPPSHSGAKGRGKAKRASSRSRKSSGKRRGRRA